MKQEIKMICSRCRKPFIRASWNQVLCGSLHKKTGCSYKARIEKQMGYNKKSKGVERQTQYVLYNIGEPSPNLNVKPYKYWFMN